jgi:uncharacterized repeat protein (TIGR03987 family)
MDLTIMIISTVSITLALIFYSIGVWSERLAKILKPKHLAFFWAGLVFDTTGTTLMMQIADGNFLNLHGLTGFLAILLMLFHAIWATLTLIKHDEARLRSFHRFSLVVWLVWLVPYIIGMVINMPGI